MAKGVEDTAFYRYARLLALNDVGGDPSRFGISVDALPRRQPRARPALPAQPAGHPDARHQALGRRARPDRRAGRHARRVGGARAPLVRGVLAAARARTRSSATSSSRRWSAPGRSRPSGSSPTWRRRCARPSARRAGSSPTRRYEDRVKAFCRALYEHRPFLSDFEPFAAEVARAGDRAALGQLLLKLTVPGVPDIYQGDELLALSLVDPDNRRPVDWDAPPRAARRGPPRRRADRRDAKLWLIVRALTLRAHRPDAFGGAYTPVEAGPDAVRVPARRSVLAATALRAGVPDAAVDVPAGTWRDVLGGGSGAVGPHAARGAARRARRGAARAHRRLSCRHARARRAPTRGRNTRTRKPFAARRSPPLAGGAGPTGPRTGREGTA